MQEKKLINLKKKIIIIITIYKHKFNLAIINIKYKINNDNFSINFSFNCITQDKFFILI